MAKTSPLLMRLNQFLFIIFSLLMPSPFISSAPKNVAHAFAAHNAKIASGRRMMAIHEGTQIRARHHGRSVSSNVMRKDSSGHKYESRTWCRKSRKTTVRAKSLAFTSVIASFLLAIKPASAESSIISSATELLNNLTTPKSSYHLTRILFLRFLAIVYTAAFSIAKFQNKGLIGTILLSSNFNLKSMTSYY